MGDPITSSQHQEVAMGTSTVTTVISTDTQEGEIPTLHLKLKKPRSGRKVQWTTETVDNESMNRKKSKCCCIYKKAKEFGESSSSDSDDECDHCNGHVEKKKTKGACATACTPTENGGATLTINTTPPLDERGDPPPSETTPP